MSLSNPHATPAGDCISALATRAEGLTTAEAARRLAEHGPNRLPEVRARGPLLRFLRQFHNVLIYVLLGAAVVTGALQHWVDTGVILAVVLANAVIGFIQEGKAEAAMAAIRGMLAPRAAVLRDGRRVSVDGADLVPGDIVLLEAGDKVPADLRVIEARGLAAQEAILTGESVPVEKGQSPVAADAALGDRRSMLWSGTLVTQGTARGLVVATGPGNRDRADRRASGRGRATDHAAGRADGPFRALAVVPDPAGGRACCWSTATSSATCPLPSCSWPWSASPSRRSPKACPR